MFKYNELSDLKDGTLVTPLSQNEEDDTILCLNQDGEKVYLSFDDFDFDKTVEERVFIVQDPVDSNDDSETEETVENSEEIAIEETTEASDETTTEEVVEKSGWVEDPSEKIKALTGISYTSLKKVLVWKDVIN